MKTIELIRRIREAHYEQLQGKTHAEQIAFYRAKAQQMNKRAEAMLPLRQPAAEAKS
ncbi:MAG: hypothetical protein HS126_15665 [Anaerolineales bacterium]|nr:hypothetical protein [Anaerolineales bacterium]